MHIGWGVAPGWLGKQGSLFAPATAWHSSEITQGEGRLGSGKTEETKAKEIQG